MLLIDKSKSHFEETKVQILSVDGALSTGTHMCKHMQIQDKIKQEIQIELNKALYLELSNSFIFVCSFAILIRKWKSRKVQEKFKVKI